jgi:ElaB/YqjD/DUF883 family membrane-anchored ribosome-binding protein
MGGIGSGTPHPQAKVRAAQMAALYQAGKTLQQIGDQYGMTRERVRQILRKHTAITRQEGGQAKKAAEKRARAAAKANDRYLLWKGCGIAEYQRIKAIGRAMRAAGSGYYRTPFGAFQNQRNNAGARGIGWELTLGQWWSIWESSGKWGERGRGQGYVMCRHGDQGPYAVGNVFIAPARENSSAKKTKRSGLPMGVGVRRGRYIAHRQIAGVLYYLGSFQSPDLAHAAYLTFTPAQQEAA